MHLAHRKCEPQISWQSSQPQGALARRPIHSSSMNWFQRLTFSLLREWVWLQPILIKRIIFWSEFFVILFVTNLINLQSPFSWLQLHPWLSQFPSKPYLLPPALLPVLTVFWMLRWKVHRPFVWLMKAFVNLFVDAMICRAFILTSFWKLL